MHKIGWILAFLCALGWLASEIRFPIDSGNAPIWKENTWRRTVDGWEKANEWTYKVEKSPPIFHPCLMGLLMVSVSVTIGIGKSD